LNILLLSHDDTRTGAPILLINLAKAIKSESPETKIGFLIKNYSGQLIDRFKSVAPVYIAEKKKQLLKSRATRFSKAHIKTALEGVDVVISNTITNGDILPIIRKYHQGLIISYVHELQMGASLFSTPHDIAELVKSTNHYMVPSRAVQNYLASSLAIQKEKIDILSYYIPLKTVPERISDNDKAAFIVGGAGTTDWRKGPDIFLAVAERLSRKMPTANIQFQWKGAIENTELHRLIYDVEKANLKNKINFIIASGEMDGFYDSIDIFLLSSREDPYPLVVLEAANASVPSICFDGSGGAEEFIKNDAGKTVAYLDIEAMTNSVISFYEDRQLLNESGHCAKKRLQEVHNSSSAIWNQLVDVIKKTS
jgi:glycosyltransferase involved in cell wall biosynthesis